MLSFAEKKGSLQATPANTQFQLLPLKNLSFSFYSKIDFIFFICFAVET